MLIHSIHEVFTWRAERPDDRCGKADIGTLPGNGLEWDRGHPAVRDAPLSTVLPELRG